MLYTKDYGIIAWSPAGAELAAGGEKAADFYQSVFKSVNKYFTYSMPGCSWPADYGGAIDMMNRIMGIKKPGHRYTSSLFQL